MSASPFSAEEEKILFEKISKNEKISNIFRGNPSEWSEEEKKDVLSYIGKASGKKDNISRRLLFSLHTKYSEYAEQLEQENTGDSSNPADIDKDDDDEADEDDYDLIDAKSSKQSKQHPAAQKEESEDNEDDKDEDKDEDQYDSFIEEAKRRVELGSTSTSRNSRSTTSSTEQPKIVVNEIFGYNLIRSDSRYPKNPKLDKWADTKKYKVEDKVLTFILGEENAAKYKELRENYLKFIENAAKRYNIRKDCKTHKWFTVTTDTKDKSSYSVSYTTSVPKTDGKGEKDQKKSDISERDLKTFSEFHAEIAKLINNSKTNKVVTEDSQFQLLKTEVIKSPFILDYKVMTSDCIVEGEGKSKTRDSIIKSFTFDHLHPWLKLITDESVDDQDSIVEGIIRWCAMNDKNVVSNSPHLPYLSLLSAIKGFKGTSLTTMIQKIYGMREIINTHKKVRKIDEHLWKTAAANIMSIEKPTEIEQIWKNVLQSQYMFYIMMYNVPNQTWINRGLMKLLKHPESIKLYTRELYPISWLFLPTAIGGKNISATLLANSNKTAYHATINAMITEFITENSSTDAYDNMNWMYYIINKDLNTNDTVALIQWAMDNESVVKPKASKK